MAALAALCVGALALAPVAGAAGPRGLPPLANAALLGGLDAAERAALARHGFVVTGPLLQRDRRFLSLTSLWFNQDTTHQVYWQFGDLYEENYSHGIPNFITTDAVLHTFGAIYDQTLLALEHSVFGAKLEQLSAGLLTALSADEGAARDPRLRAAAQLDLAYAAVALRLLDPGARIPAPVAPAVGRELALILAHRGPARSPTFGEMIDYADFTPRGHYAQDAGLARYFRAITWLSRPSFALGGPGGAARTRQALLLARAIALSPALSRLWSAIYDPLAAWLSAASHNLTVRDYAALMARVYPPHAPVRVLADDARLTRFMVLANRLRASPGLGDVVSNQAAPGVRGLRLFGQNSTPDGAILHALVYDRVGTARQPRRWPLGLDVAAALGSARAAALLTGPLDQRRYARYPRTLAALQRSYTSLPATAWSRDLYAGWLNTLRAVWAPVPPLAPAFMQSAAWADKTVATGLGSWTELRHGAIVYRQIGGFGGGGAAPPPTVAYVEPAPLVYLRLLNLTRQLKATLAGVGLLDRLPLWINTFSAQNTPGFLPPLPTGERGYHAALDGFASLIALLERASERELEGQPVGHEEMQALINMGADLALLTDFFNATPLRRDAAPFDAQVARVADVFDEPVSGQVLEEGVGDVLPLYAVVTINGQRWLARGGVYSYYELHRPAGALLTDEAWRGLPHRPAQPSWTTSYIAY